MFKLLSKWYKKWFTKPKFVMCGDIMNDEYFIWCKLAKGHTGSHYHDCESWENEDNKDARADA